MKIRRKCHHCQCFFHPDPRNRYRQRYCKETACRRASKAASQRRWLAKPENQNYFRGPDQVARVQTWRQANPQRSTTRVTRSQSTATPTEQNNEPMLQETLTQQPVDFKGENEVLSKETLQETLNTQHLVLTGLIGKFADSVLQEDIAHMTNQLVRLGRDIVGGRSPPAL